MVVYVSYMVNAMFNSIIILFIVGIGIKIMNFGIFNYRTVNTVFM